MSGKRFRVAFSFAGEKREFVAEVAAILAKKFGEDKILYDKYHLAEFARRDLGIYLPELYHKESDLVVVVVCPNYDDKKWTWLEWVPIHDLLSQRKDEDVMLTRFEYCQVKGIYGTAGFIELDDLKPIDFAKLILERLALNEGLPKDTYTKPDDVDDKPKDRQKLWMLPAQPTPFFTGQLGKLDEIRAKLLQHKPVGLTQSMTLVGEGGVGKTELAIQYCHKFEGDYDHVFWFSGRDRDALMNDLTRACEAMFGTNDGLEGQPTAGLQRAIRMRDELETMARSLVVIDNVDDLEGVLKADDEAVAEVGANVRFLDPLLAMKGPHVLITSRQEHWGDYANTLDVKMLSPEDGALLFLKRVRNLTDSTLEEFSEEDQKAGLALSQEVGGFQLALEQAGTTARAYNWTPKKYGEEFEKRFAEFMSKHGSGARTKHDAVQVTIAESLRLVEARCPQAGALIRWCAYMPPDWIPMEVFEVEEGTVAESLVGLSLEDSILAARAQSLLHFNEEQNVYTMHRLVQRVVLLLDSGSENGSPARWDELAVAAKIADPGTEVKDWPAAERLVPVWRHLGGFGPDSEPIVRVLNCLTHFGLIAWGGLGILADAELAVMKGKTGLGDQHLLTLTSLSNLALTYSYLGRHEQSLSLQEEVLNARKQVLGEIHPDTLRSMNNLARTYSKLGRHEEALKLQEEVLTAQKQEFGERHPDTLFSMNNLGATYSDLGRHDQALSLQEEVLNSRKQVLGERHPGTLNSMNNLGLTYSNLRRDDQALTLQEEVLNARKQVLGDRHPETLRSMNNLAVTYWNLDRKQEAITLMEEATKGHLAALGAEHPDTKNSLAWLAHMKSCQ